MAKRMIRMSDADLRNEALRLSTPAQAETFKEWHNENSPWILTKIIPVKGKYLISSRAKAAGGMMMIIYPDGHADFTQGGETVIKFDFKHID